MYLTGEYIPKKRTIERIISNNAEKIGIIKSKIKDNPLDKAWTIGACAEYSEYFPPESIPILVEYIQYLKTEPPENSLVNFTGKLRLEICDLSIRDSIWLIRLKPFIEKYFAKDIAINKELLMSLPILIACTYAESELSNEVMDNEKFDTSHIDNALFSGDIQAFTKISEEILEAIYFSYRKEIKE